MFARKEGGGFLPVLPFHLQLTNLSLELTRPPRSTAVLIGLATLYHRAAA